MAKDNKKEDFYHTRETHYQDWEGNWHPFSIVDHDKKTSTAAMQKGKSKATLEKEKEESTDRNNQLKSYNEEKIDEILQFPAVYSALPSDDFIQAHLFSEIISKEEGDVKWDNTILREICSIDREFTSKLHTRLWQHHIKPEYQKEELTHEDMMAGKWKSWI